MRGFACELHAISAADRPRYGELVKRVRGAIRDRAEIADGYTFRLDGDAMTLSEVLDWIRMESLCCPFLTVQVAGGDEAADWVLTITGPAGAKALIAAEFPA